MTGVFVTTSAINRGLCWEIAFFASLIGVFLVVVISACRRKIRRARGHVVGCTPLFSHYHTPLLPCRAPPMAAISVQWRTRGIWGHPTKTFFHWSWSIALCQIHTLAPQTLELSCTFVELVEQSYSKTWSIFMNLYNIHSFEYMTCEFGVRDPVAPPNWKWFIIVFKYILGMIVMNKISYYFYIFLNDNAPCLNRWMNVYLIDV
jgi:hypothetical protein